MIELDNLEQAANEIERLEGVITKIAEFCSGELGTLGAVERLIQIRKIAHDALGLP